MINCNHQRSCTSISSFISSEFQNTENNFFWKTVSGNMNFVLKSLKCTQSEKQYGWLNHEKVGWSTPYSYHFNKFQIDVINRLARNEGITESRASALPIHDTIYWLFKHTARIFELIWRTCRKIYCQFMAEKNIKIRIAFKDLLDL